MGVGLAAYGVGRYEAWWTIAFAIGAFGIGVAVLRHGAAPSIVIGVAISACISLGMLGLFAVYGAIAPGYGPCTADQCSNPSLDWGLVAVASLSTAAIGLRLTLRFARRSAG